MEFEIYKKAQDAAKKVHAALGEFIDSESTERSIAAKSKELLSAQGVTDTWYHEVPAFVLLGSRSCLSISGREYRPSEEKVGQTNLVTVDLSPMLGVAWGDCARSYCVEKGAWTDCPSPRYILLRRFLHVPHADVFSGLSAEDCGVANHESCVGGIRC